MPKSKILSLTIILVLVLAVAVTPAFAKKIGPHGGRPLYAKLAGTNEVPGPGDADGTGRVLLTLNQGQGEICFQIQVTNLTLPPTGSHIHAGAAGVAGAVVVDLAATFDANGYALGCVTGLEKATIKAIRQHPKDYYVNVHTLDYPAGAVRGQLSKKNK